MSALLVALVLGQTPGPPAKLANAVEVRTKLGITPHYRNTTNLSRVTVAVLDFGFDGYDPARGQLPASTEIVEHYDPAWVTANDLGPADYKKGFEPGSTHGRLMAQAVWAATGNAATGPKFLLLNANGPTLFRRAVRFAIDRKADVILFSGHFEGGGNYDGRGPINAAVSDAVKAGILWVNAAGNHHGRVYSGPIKLGADGFLTFAGKPDLRFRNRLDENSFTVTLTWNDYRDREDAGTTKDLALVVQDSTGKELAVADLKQVADKPAGETESRNPRERLTLPNLAAGVYRIRIQARGGSFADTDRLRIHLSPARGEPYPHPTTGEPTDPVEFFDASKAEELFPPADHPRVLTVGESSDYSARGPTADRRVKPDLLVPPLPAKWTNGEVAGGTSYTAAYFAGLVTAMKAEYPELQTDDLMRWLSRLRKEKGQPVTWRTPTPTELAAVMASRR